MEGMYTSRKRVERDGWLIAFEGEVMSMDEAARRGLLDGEREEEGPKEGEAKKKGKKVKADWIAEAEALGVEVPKDATIDQIKALIESAPEAGGEPAAEAGGEPAAEGEGE